MTADNLPALRTTRALAVIPTPPAAPAPAHSTSDTLFGLAALGTVLTAFSPLSVDPRSTAVGMGAATITALGLGIHERHKEKNQ